jgi:hypothetical protein
MNSPDITVYVYCLADLIDVTEAYTKEGLYDVEVFSVNEGNNIDPLRAAANALSAPPGLRVQEWCINIKRR